MFDEILTYILAIAALLAIGLACHVVLKALADLIKGGGSAAKDVGKGAGAALSGLGGGVGGALSGLGSGLSAVGGGLGRMAGGLVGGTLGGLRSVGRAVIGPPSRGGHFLGGPRAFGHLPAHTRSWLEAFQGLGARLPWQAAPSSAMGLAWLVSPDDVPALYEALCTAGIEHYWIGSPDGGYYLVMQEGAVPVAGAVLDQAGMEMVSPGEIVDLGSIEGVGLDLGGGE